VNPASQVAHTYTLPPSRGSSMCSSRTATSGSRRHSRRDGRTPRLSRCGPGAQSCTDPMSIANAAESATCGLAIWLRKCFTSGSVALRKPSLRTESNERRARPTGRRRDHGVTGGS
jgi:hypothetical protein